MKKILLLGLLTAGCFEAASADDAPLYKNPSASVEDRVKDLAGRMTLEEKISYCSGVHGFYITDVPRLGLPTISMKDGPVGVHGGGTTFPPGIALSASFDPDLANQVGQALGRDCRALGVNVILGPGINMSRDPLGGRAAEYFGEDPFLTGHMASSWIRGVQSQGVMACAKHFVGNELELFRTGSDSIIDERTLREIYLAPFETAVKDGDVASIMGGYNHVNGFPASANPHLLQDVLRDEWKFDGFVMSDWGAGSGSAATFAMSPLDLAMPKGPMGDPAVVLPLIKAGKIDPAVYDQKVANILRKIIAFGFLDRPQKDPAFKVRDPSSLATALRVSSEGTVLLKNDHGLLPLDTSTIHSIALIGPNADLASDHTPYPTGPSGSAYNDSPASAIVTIAKAMQELAGPNVKIVVVPDYMGRLYATTAYEHPGPDGKPQPGLSASYFTNDDFSGTPALQRVDKDLDFGHRWRNQNWLKELGAFKRLSVRWTGSIRPTTTGLYRIAKESNLGMQVWLDGEMIMDDDGYFASHRTVCPTMGVVKTLEAGRTYSLKIEYMNHREVAHMLGVRFGWGPAEPTAEIDAARSCDAVIACVGSIFMTEGEGVDRTWELPYGQADVLQAVSKVNHRTIVVLNGGGACATDGWIDQVPAFLDAWYFGEDGAKAVAGILLGQINPSGKLPITFAKRWEDNPAAPYVNVDTLKPGLKPVNYTEGIFVGYRGFDHAGTEPLFPFGYGLSYTTFDYRNLKIEKEGGGKDLFSVTCDITNTGKRPGAEVAELYVGEVLPPVPRPPWELKGFQRIELQPDETKSAHFTLQARDLSYYDVTRKDWVLPSGKFNIAVGSSSRDLRQQGNVQVGSSAAAKNP